MHRQECCRLLLQQGHYTTTYIKRHSLCTGKSAAEYFCSTATTPQHISKDTLNAQARVLQITFAARPLHHNIYQRRLLTLNAQARMPQNTFAAKPLHHKKCRKLNIPQHLSTDTLIAQARVLQHTFAARPLHHEKCRKFNIPQHISTDTLNAQARVLQHTFAARPLHHEKRVLQHTWPTGKSAAEYLRAAECLCS